MCGNPDLRVPLRFAVSMVKEAVIIDDYTVQLNLAYPFAPLDATLSMSRVSAISPAALEKYGEDVRQHPVGLGPYVLSEWVKGDRIVLTRNEEYWGKTPTVDKLTFKVIPRCLAIGPFCAEMRLRRR
jgi:peptide/nickel transport system substrate-binding protein